MKKALLAVLLLVASIVARADTIPLLKGTLLDNGSSAPIEVAGFSAVGTQIWSAAGSVATITIECSSDPNGAVNSASPWFPCTVRDNISATGEYVQQTRVANWVRATISNYTSGAIYVNLVRIK